MQPMSPADRRASSSASAIACIWPCELGSVQWWPSPGTRIAGDAGVHGSAARPRVLRRFQHEEHRAFAEHDAAAAAVERAAGGAGVVAERCQHAQRLPGLDGAVAERRFGAAGQRHVEIAVADRPHRLADGHHSMRRRRRRRRRSGSGHAARGGWRWRRRDRWPGSAAGSGPAAGRPHAARHRNRSPIRSGPNCSRRTGRSAAVPAHRRASRHRPAHATMPAGPAACCGRPAMFRCGRAPQRRRHERAHPGSATHGA